MDDIVRQAMVKWPHVPDCYAWLGLDSRGQWHMRDERVQQLGTFQCGEKGAKGSVLRHEKLIEFIHRNYDADEQGRWYFQNGPQRVFIELELAPYIWRLNHQFETSSHTGQATEVLGCLIDEVGRVYLNTKIGFGLVHTLDVGYVAEAIDMGLWTPEECFSCDLPMRFGYVISPEQAYKGQAQDVA